MAIPAHQTRTCPFCPNKITPKVYTNGQKETPAAFAKRGTCGNRVCADLLRERTLEENRRKREADLEVAAVVVTTMDRFIYGRV